MDPKTLLNAAPVVAVLRGIAPEEAEAVADALLAAGVRVLEVTLDSPEPYRSLRLAAARCAAFGDGAIAAAGTTLKPEQVPQAAEAGAALIVAPNFSPKVVAAARAAGLPSCPGVMTPSEAFAALEEGADMLKLFPGDAVTPKVVKGLRAVLPPVPLMVTGGVDAETIPAFLKAGADGVGLGSALYKPGKSAEAIGADAARFVAIAREARG